MDMEICRDIPGCIDYALECEIELCIFACSNSHIFDADCVFCSARGNHSIPARLDQLPALAVARKDEVHRGRAFECARLHIRYRVTRRRIKKDRIEEARKVWIRSAV